VYGATVKVTPPVIVQDDGLLTGIPETVQVVSPVANPERATVINVPGIAAVGVGVTVGVA
jgi:hypothetical protein